MGFFTPNVSQFRNHQECECLGQWLLPLHRSQSQCVCGVSCFCSDLCGRSWTDVTVTSIWCCPFDLIQQWCFLKTSPHALQAVTKGGLRPPCLVSLPVFCSKCSSVAFCRACLLSIAPVMSCASRFSAGEINASGWASISPWILALLFLSSLLYLAAKIIKNCFLQILIFLYVRQR